MNRLIPLAFLALTACEEVAVTGEPTVDMCQAAAYQGILGRSIDELDDWLLVQQPYRVIRPGDAVTEDYSPSRLNIRLDGTDRVVAVDCG
jgi:hypothetical protein